MRRRGFTLIELLVVVAIIALLIAILLPSLNQARQQARTVACQSNVHNMMSAVWMYATSHNGTFPLAKLHGGFQDGGWINELVPYAGNKLLYRCPSDKSTDWYVEGVTPPGDAINDRQNSYSMNIYMTPQVTPPPGAPDPTPLYGFVNLEKIRFASETIYMGEYKDTQGTETAEDALHAEWWVPSPITGLITAPPESQVAIGRHLQRRENYGYVDSHAVSQPFKATLVLDASTTPATVVRNHWDPAFRIRQGQN